jgi:hypothetical protein
MTAQLNASATPSHAFSVVVPAYGPTPYLIDLIHSLAVQTPQPAKIVVVHTGSDDPSIEIAASCKHLSTPLSVIHQSDRLYASAARNRGVEEIDTPWVAFLDCDVLPAPDYCASVAQTVAATNAACLIGSVTTASKGGYWGRCMWFIEFGSVHPYLPERPIETGPSINMIVRRDIFLEIGGFPNEVAVGEDAICQLRLKAMGAQLEFIPTIEVGHHMVSGFAPFRRHLRPLGAAAAQVRKRFKLTGSRAAANPLLASGLWLARLGQIALRVSRHGRGERLQSIALIPGILLGLLIWNWSFLRNRLSEHEITMDPEVDAKVLANTNRNAVEEVRCATSETDRPR